MFHFVYYAKSFNCPSCLEEVPLDDFKKLCYCSGLSRIVMCTKSGSLSLGSFYGFNLYRQYGSHDADAYSSIGRTRVV